MSNAILLDKHECEEKVVEVNGLPEIVVAFKWGDTIYVNSNIKSKGTDGTLFQI